MAGEGCDEGECEVGEGEIGGAVAVVFGIIGGEEAEVALEGEVLAPGVETAMLSHLAALVPDGAVYELEEGGP